MKQNGRKAQLRFSIIKLFPVLPILFFRIAQPLIDSRRIVYVCSPSMRDFDKVLVKLCSSERHISRSCTSSTVTDLLSAGKCVVIRRHVRHDRSLVRLDRVDHVCIQSRSFPHLSRRIIFKYYKDFAQGPTAHFNNILADQKLQQLSLLSLLKLLYKVPSLKFFIPLYSICFFVLPDSDCEF